MNLTTSNDFLTLCADFSFAGEFAAAKLGDLRLTRRAVLFADSSLRHPEASIPRMAGGASGAEGLYRFIANEKVTAENLARPHYDQTVARCHDVGAVLILHDTTTFGYGKDTKRRGMGETAGGGIGFMSHVSLAVLEGSRRPLDMLAHRSYVHVAKKESEDKAESDASLRHRVPIEGARPTPTTSRCVGSNKRWPPASNSRAWRACMSRTGRRTTTSFSRSWSLPASSA